ncbi:FAD-binding oxidoreductase [Sulfuracidifex tepidarius]|uniref:D-lactate dehydrogenase n=1 Tax=Sulfuracidifex tepidarius TaxID=1294262 RepID=A0A510E5L6_9CREN|nr:FAD-binding oxidoreductase [Sulfuracidifex tepidarius]BBG25041.1 D-lactate dehydrogenase [Sulfuracidifex tepidarius]BBG27822.1 D-lactate dehydrogenase [Sulfuracidifex tepidarius]
MDTTFVMERLRKEGVNVTDDSVLVNEKSKDWSFVSPRLSHLSGKADLVAFPKSEEDVVKVVEVALEEHVPLVPRGAGYGTVGGAVPLKGGILIDMSLMKEVISDEDTVRAQAGAPFSFRARVYPTIWSKTSVGGYFCGGSWGIGSYQYGPNWDQVTEIRMVNPKGKLVTLRGGDVKVAAHAEGTTGIVTELKILTRDEEDQSKIILFDSLQDASKFIEKIYDDEVPLYHMTLRSPEMGKATEKSVGYYTGKWELLVVYPKDSTVYFDGMDGSPLWSKRNMFFAAVYVNMHAMRKNVYYSQYHIPIEDMTSAIESVKSAKPIVESEFASDGKAHTYFLTEDVESFLVIEKIMGTSTFNLHDIRIDGRLPRNHLHRIKTYKKAYDKEDLFNPGKVGI